ncbi:hypothetical protein Tco_0974208 [Tanacetum coccineum]|uniref:Uncharacterized protein n=1 Tax=Tanacetum coccineum TaxID=301880 RepID=A0ABQ5EB46_9ASTR
MICRSLVRYDNDNENDDLGYQSEEYFDEVDEEDENNHSNRNVVKRGITRLYKFRREYGKPDGIKLSVTFDALNRISGKHRALFLSFLGDMVREHIGLKILSWKKVDSEARDKLWDEITKETEDKIKEGTFKVDHGTDAMTVVLGKKREVMQEEWEMELHTRGGLRVDSNPINSSGSFSADEEGGTPIFGCENDASIQKSNGLATLEKKMETRVLLAIRKEKKGSHKEGRPLSALVELEQEYTVAPLLVHDRETECARLANAERKSAIPVYFVLCIK